MLFVLDESLIDNLKSSYVREALSHIALGRREGKHLIFSEKQETLKTLAGYDFFDNKTRSIYKNIYEKLAFKKIYYETFIRRIRVIAGNNKDTIAPVTWQPIGNNKEEIIIHASIIRDSFFIQKTIMLCEDETDCKLYKRMAEVSMIKKNGKIKISCEPRSGGGSRIADIYKNIDNRLCLCISENDRKYPSGLIGSTAKRLKKIKKQPSISECLIIEYREIENLISTSMFNLVSDTNRISGINSLEEIEKTECAKARKFIDIKNGMNANDYFKTPFQDKGTPLYWKNLLNKIRSFNNETIDPICFENKECQNPSNCKCVIISGLGDHILEAVTEKLKEQTPHKTSELICVLLRPDWQKYGELIAAWCCGSNRISV